MIFNFQSLDALGAIDECPGNSEFKRQSTSLAIHVVSLLWVKKLIYAWNTVVVVATLIDMQNWTIVLLQNSRWKKKFCQVLHLYNAFFNCFLLWFHLNLINDHYFFASESSDVPVDIFNKQGLLPYLVSSLKTDIYPKTVAIPAGEFLLFFIKGVL